MTSIPSETCHALLVSNRRGNFFGKDCRSCHPKLKHDKQSSSGQQLWLQVVITATHQACWEDTSARIPHQPASPPDSAALLCRRKQIAVSFNIKKQTNKQIKRHHVILTCRQARPLAAPAGVSHGWEWTSQPAGAPRPHLETAAHSSFFTRVGFKFRETLVIALQIWREKQTILCSFILLLLLCCHAHYQSLTLPSCLLLEFGSGAVMQATVSDHSFDHICIQVSQTGSKTHFNATSI